MSAGYADMNGPFRTAPVPALLAVSFLALLGLAAVACGGGDGGDGTRSAAATTAETVTADGVATPPSATADGSSTETKTLDDYLGVAANFVRGGAGAGAGATFDDERLAEEQRLIQQEIQRCMQAQGFQYTPEETTGGLRVFLAAGNQGVSAAEYAESEGFGISTRFDAIFEGEIDFSEDAGPNDEHVATLSEGEADAWQLALSGEPPERNAQGQLIDPETGDPIQGGPGRPRGGCTGEAQVTVRGDFSVLGELVDEFAELDERIAADPRVAEIAREWADCMRAAGFSYETEAEARDAIAQQLRPLLFSFFGRGPGQDPDGQQQAGQGQGGQGGGNRLQRLAGLELTPEQDAELNALQDLEREIAVASHTCQGETGAEVDEITARYEAEFVAANRDTLEAIAG